MGGGSFMKIVSRVRETIHHIFFLCPTEKYIWSMVSKTIRREMDLVVLLNTSGGFKNLYLKLVRCRLWPVRPYVEPSGSLEIALALN